MTAHRDELPALLSELLKDPEARAAFEEANARHDVIDGLVAARRRKKLTQKQVAEAMGRRQPGVSEFESEQSDPRLSTLLRYARAVGVRLEIKVVDRW